MTTGARETEATGMAGEGAGVVAAAVGWGAGEGGAVVVARVVVVVVVAGGSVVERVGGESGARTGERTWGERAVCFGRGVEGRELCLVARSTITRARGTENAPPAAARETTKTAATRDSAYGQRPRRRRRLT